MLISVNAILSLPTIISLNVFSKMNGTVDSGYRETKTNFTKEFITSQLK